MTDSAETYPGENNTAEDVLRLAGEYKRAAKALKTLWQPGHQLSSYPYRLAVIQAIELYLGAFLIAAGFRPTEVRSMGHDIAARAAKAKAFGLALRVKTEAHLTALVDQREYLSSRYGNDQTTQLSQLNRLAATLEEIEKKVTCEVDNNATNRRPAIK